MPVKTPVPKKTREKITRKFGPNSGRLVPKALLQEFVFKNGQVRKTKVLTPKEYKALEKTVYAKLKKLDGKRHLPYHNLKHTQAVVRRAQALARIADLSPEDKQLLQIAALFHDLEHGYSPAAQKRLTNEERSCLMADDWARKAGLSLEQRLKLMGLIIATTFSNPEIFPRTRLERLLVIADLGGFKNSTKAWLQESMHVTAETPRQRRPRNLQDWLQEQQNFLAYVRRRLPVEAKKLQWDKALEEKKKMLQKLSKHPYHHRAYTPIIKKLEKLLG